MAQGLLTGKFSSADDVPPGRARMKLFSGKREGSRHGGDGHEDEVFEALKRIRKICREAGQSMSALSLAWLLASPSVSSVLAGARNPAQIAENAEASDLNLSDDLRQDLAAATNQLKIDVGSDVDMWADRIR
jgi:aryl-alcohol dehydrogenase-like predicted oxidoreductase